jgi:hypothetical protein
VLATACATVFLKKKMADRRDEWELVAEKANVWLEAQLGGNEKMQKLFEAIDGLFSS